jgi:3-mercaptopyruvate sulfurtransferase SseA
MFKVKGFTKVFALQGGFNDWLAAKYPTEPK